MNRNFENRKPTKVYAKSKENQMIIKALNMYGRVPEMWELLKEIERLNNIIKELEKENQELKEKTKLFHKNGVFSLEYDKETLRDMVLEYQEKIDKALEKINDYKIYCKENKGFTEYTDIEIEAIEPVISKLEDILKEGK